MRHYTVLFLFTLFCTSAFSQDSANFQMWDTPFMSQSTISETINESTVANSLSDYNGNGSFPVLTRFSLDEQCDLNTFYLVFKKPEDFTYSAQNNRSYHNLVLKTNGRNFRQKLHPVMEHSKFIAFMAKAPRTRGFLRTLEGENNNITAEILIHANRHSFQKEVSPSALMQTIEKNIQVCKNAN